MIKKLWQLTWHPMSKMQQWMSLSFIILAVFFIGLNQVSTSVKLDAWLSKYSRFFISQDTFFDIQTDPIEMQLDELDKSLLAASTAHHSQVTTKQQAILSKLNNTYEIKANDKSFVQIFTDRPSVHAAVTRLIELYPELIHLPVGTLIHWQIDGDKLQLLDILKPNLEGGRYVRTSYGFIYKAFLSDQVQQKRKELSMPAFEVVTGEIKTNFYQSAHALGLTLKQIQTIITALQWQVDLGKAKMLHGELAVTLRRISQNDDRYLKEGQVEAVLYRNQYGEYQAVRAKDGLFYQADGLTLQKTFWRTPLKRHAPISSSFNPHRLHPITGKVAPHLGTDFAVPVGTKVYATSQGQVIKVAQHPLAGNYVVIRNSRDYSTRFLHLSQALVHVGDFVHQGDLIAYSGNTGASTGPHLHYELMYKGQPVDAMTQALPKASNVSLWQQRKFKKKAHYLISQMQHVLPKVRLFHANQKVEQLPNLRESIFQQSHKASIFPKYNQDAQVQPLNTSVQKNSKANKTSLFNAVTSS